MLRVTVLMLLAFTAGAARVASSDTESKPSGIAKVVKILTDMRTQLEKEAENDQEVMDKMVCWCETNDKAKTKAIADNTQKEATLGAAIEEYTASVATLKSELEDLAKDIAENTKELEEATNLREKEAGEFAEDEAEQLASIKGLTGAVKTLGSKLELRQESLLQVTQVLQGHGKAGVAILRKLGLTAAQRHEVQSFLQASSKTSSKTPGSNEVLGVLKQMKENFETNYKEAQDTENEAKKAFAELKASKDKEIASCTSQSDAKSAQLADTTERLSQAKVDLTDTRATLKADTEFLADLKDRCENMDEEFAERSKMRAEEITAVSEALGILTSDDAKDQFTKSLGFVQVRRHQNSKSAASMRAARLVSAAAKKAGSPRLAALAMSIRAGDVFAKIKEAIDGMLVQLKQENKDEIKHKDWCIEQLHENEMQTDDAYDRKKELSTQDEDLALLIDNLSKEIEADKAEVADMKVQLKRATEDRQAENADFQMTINDQQATQKLLKAALEKLRDFYKNKALLQVRADQKQTSGQAPPPGFGGEYKKSGGATGVMMMIEGVIKESKTVETEAIAAEQEATTAYEGFVADTNKGIETLNKGLAEKEASKGKAAADLARTGSDIKANLADLKSLNDVAGELHMSCDFTLKFFEVRQNARAEEMEALNQAKAVLSGANLS